MLNSKASDHGDSQQKQPDSQALKAPEAEAARQASGADLASAMSARTNASDGSLRRFCAGAAAAQEHSIELVSGDEKISRTNSLTEKDLEERASVRSKIENLSSTLQELGLRAKENPALEPVAQLRKYAEELTPGEKKDSLIRLSREQAAELSPEMAERFKKIAERRERINRSELDRVVTVNFSEAGGQPSIDTFGNTGKEALWALQSARHDINSCGANDLIAQLISKHEFISDGTTATARDGKQIDGVLLAEKAKQLKADDSSLLVSRFKEDLTSKKDSHLDYRDVSPSKLPRPVDGDDLKFDDFLTKYQTIVGDAYEMSRHLSKGAPGKLETLEKLIERLQKCPWASKIHVKFDRTVDHPDYDPANSTITINPNDSPLRQLQDFAHESYHATHQAMTRLYAPERKLKAAAYADIKIDLEAHCYESEVLVTNELRKLVPDVESSTYAWTNLKGEKQPEMNLCDLYARKGFAGLKSFIADEALTRMDTVTKLKQLMTYRHFYETTSYSAYDKAYEAGVKFTQQALKTRPDFGSF